MKNIFIEWDVWTFEEIETSVFLMHLWGLNLVQMWKNLVTIWKMENPDYMLVLFYGGHMQDLYVANFLS